MVFIYSYILLVVFIKLDRIFLWQRGGGWRSRFASAYVLLLFQGGEGEEEGGGGVAVLIEVQVYSLYIIYRAHDLKTHSQSLRVKKPVMLFLFNSFLYFLLYSFLYFPLHSFLYFPPYILSFTYPYNPSSTSPYIPSSTSSQNPSLTAFHFILHSFV